MQKYFCTECSYVYSPMLWEEDMGISPGTNFEDIEESLWECPGCGSGKELFIAPKQEIQEALDPDDIIEEELVHIPFYSFDTNGVRVEIGNEDFPHPSEEDHMIEWVGLFDEDGEIVEVVYNPNTDEPILFKNYEEWDFFEVRSSCNVHGIWKGLPKKI